jgi:hypothetical protein
MNGKRPCKSNRPKERAKILDDFDYSVIKTTIHGLYSRKIAPTVYLHAFVTIKRLPLPDGIVAPSDPSFGSHI